MSGVRVALAVVMALCLVVPVSAPAAGLPRSLTCASLGWSGGNAKSLQIANRAGGVLVVRAGTTFRWTMSPSGQTGVITLDADLKAGSTKVYDNLLKGALEQNTDCKISAA